MSGAKMTVTLVTGFELCLAVPTEMNATGFTFHVHTPAILFNTHSTFRAHTSVVGIFVNPLQHFGMIFTATKHAAEDAGV